MYNETTHRAASDAHACATLSLKVLELKGTASEAKFETKMGNKISWLN
jgi:DNA polymerase III subunit epsilon